MNQQPGEARGDGLNRSYMTKAGDTLEAIAAFFYGSEERRDALIERNYGLDQYGPNATLPSGFVLRVPDEAGVELSDQRGATEGEGADRLYFTKPGDSLEDIAAFFYGSSGRRDRIEAENPQVAGMDQLATLPPGLCLRVPADA